MFEPKAEIIGDAINTMTGVRLTSFQVTFHRFVLAEFNTHRMLSRNAASSRAIPVHKQVERMFKEDVQPLHWGLAQKGMQAQHELDGWRKQVARLLWSGLRFVNAVGALALAKLGTHKQIANRVIEPYTTCTMIVSATEWKNFFALRAHPDAQPEFQALAKLMQQCYNESTPKEIQPGRWYIPERYDIGEQYDLRTRLQAAVGKIARVSYLTHEGKADVEKDILLFNRLISGKPIHASPLEHVALATTGINSGNFEAGWKQFRHIVQQEPTYWTNRG